MRPGSNTQKLDKFGNKEFNDIVLKGSFRRDKETRDKLIKRAISVFDEFFEDSYDQVPDDEYMRIVNIMTSAVSEEQMFDFKVGVTDFVTGAKNEACVSSIVKDLAAMVNTKPGEEGTVVLGVPNNNSDAKKVSERFGIKPTKYNEFYITGIREEAEQCFDGLDNYLKFIKSCIENEPVSEIFKNEILENMRPVRCADKIVILFTAKATREVYYDRELNVRHGSHNTLVTFDSEVQHRIIDAFSKIRNNMSRETAGKSDTNSMSLF